MIDFRLAFWLLVAGWTIPVPVSAQMTPFQLVPGGRAASDSRSDEVSATARLSKTQTTVGEDVLLEVRINQAGKYGLPSLPKVDGLRFESLGPPSRSSQTQIVTDEQGQLRRSTQQSVSFRYRVIASREGVFEIPAIEVPNDGQTLKTSPVRLAVKAAPPAPEPPELKGEPIFVEIEGQQQEVYVGQALELTLNLWIQVYQDDTLQVRLSEGTMWNQIKDSSRWGIFDKRMRELADKGQRPAGHEVLRDDGTGEQRAYYLYQIDATVYPKRPGKIDSDDLEVVVDYPLRLGKSRNQMRSLLDDDFFGGSLFSRMMQDDFFRSPLDNRVRLLKSKEFQASVQSDETRVLAVPSEGRPPEYQGAVGQYEIETSANLRRVKAGDPIVLQIQVTGDGPLELVQAPPLNGLKDDFLIENGSLAGIVRDGKKYFQTTIRPKHEQVQQIPALKLGYFDPNERKFQIAQSQAIDIRVDAAETLALGSIIGDDNEANDNGSSGSQASDSLGSWTKWVPAWVTGMLSPTLDSSASINGKLSIEPELLTRATPASMWRWWWMGGLAPLAISSLFILGLRRREWMNALQSFRSARSLALRQIASADQAIDFERAFATAVRTDDFAQAMGKLRVQGRYQLASQCESLVHQARKTTATAGNWESLRDEASRLISLVSGPKRNVLPQYASTAPGTTSVIGIAMVLWVGGNASLCRAEEPLPAGNPAEAILQEAIVAYQSGEASVAADRFDALTQMGYSNASLHRNAGLAYSQSAQPIKATAHFRAASAYQPYDWTTWRLLSSARARLGLPPFTVVPPIVPLIIFVSAMILISIWLLLRVGFGLSLSIGWASPLILLALGSVAVSLVQRDQLAPNHEVIALVDQLQLRRGDGESFEIAQTLEDTAGQQFKWIHSRNGWLQIKAGEGADLWVRDQDMMVMPSVVD